MNECQEMQELMKKRTVHQSESQNLKGKNCKECTPGTVRATSLGESLSWV